MSIASERSSFPQRVPEPPAKTGGPLVIVGSGEFAEIAYQYFTYDSPYEVVAFCVERAFLQQDRLFDLPVVAFENLDAQYPPSKFHVFVAITHTKLNRVRARLYREAKARGYAPVSYVSSRAFAWHNVTIGENCFVFEQNVLQYHVQLGDGFVLWSGNPIGHRSIVRDFCFLSSHVVVSGYCDIGEHCFLGVNSAVGNNVRVAPDTVIAAGTTVTRDTEPGKVYKADREPEPRGSSLALFKVRTRD